MKRSVHFFLTICLLLACVEVLGSRTDTTARKRYKMPRSALYYQAYWAHPLKRLWIIGSIELEDVGLRFVAYQGISGWPDSVFVKRHPFNSGFKDVFIAYSEIKSINYGGRIRLENGTRHRLIGTYVKEWRTTYGEIKARAKRSRTNGGK